MKKFTFLLLVSFIAVMSSANGTPIPDKEEPSVPDSLNIPVWIVDGVEISNYEELPLLKDIESIEVLKDEKSLKLMELFRPRMGGIYILKTKSKAKLKEVIEYNKQREEESKKNQQENAKKQKPGEIIIR